MMAIMQKIKQITPFVILFLLLCLLGHELYSANPDKIAPSLVGETTPTFQLPELLKPTSLLTDKDLLGQVSLLNIWASWCSACQKEHAMLMKISNTYHVPIYGIIYRDQVNDATHWIAEHGNPYTKIGNDANGDVSIDFGIYGTPETFVINSHGRIIYHHIGVVDQNVWDNTIYPVIKKYAK